MEENPKFTFNNPNYHGIGRADKTGIDTVTSLRVLEESEKIHQTIAESLIDPLTNAYNRRYLDKFKNEHFDPTRDHNRIGFLVVDLNNLKVINDTHGHVAGDELLQHTANFLRSSIRKRDVIVRLGGDEFVLICHNNDNADDFEDTLCDRMDELLKSNLPNGFAYGCAVFDKNRDGDLDDTQGLADKRMYEYKHSHKKPLFI